MNDEKFYFLRSLISPSSWLGNVVSFFTYVERVLKFRISSKFKPAHMAMKIKPPWLPVETVSPVFLEAVSYGSRSVKTLELTGIYREQDGLLGLFQSPIPDGDPEKYLYFHRWGWIVRECLNNAITHDQAFDWIKKWIQCNTNRNEYTWEPYSCCERIANIFALLMQLPVELQKRILSGVIGSFILDSAYWIITHLEYYGPRYTNNHILNNGRSLAIAGVLTGNKNILEIACSIFKNMLPVLVTNKGFLRERSSHYQLIVLRWILDAEKALSFNGESLIGKDMDFIHRYAASMARAAMSLCDSKGMLKVLIGDVSPDAEPKETCGFLNKLYPQWKVAGGLERSCDTGEGWFFLKDGKLEVITQQMEKYPLEYPSHGHADIAGFVFLFDGRQILADPGRNSYANNSLAKRFTSGFFHNVPLVNRLAPALTPFLGNWMPEPYGSMKIDSDLSDINSLRIKHNGFSRLGKQIGHTRIISIEEGKLIVLDEFTGKGVYEIALCWHFVPGFKVETESVGRVCLSSSFCPIVITATILNNDKPASDAFSFRKVRDDDGWYSPCYGVVQEALTLRISDNFKFPVKISTTFEVQSCAE